MIKLLNGSEAIAEALVYSGVKYFYSSPAIPNHKLLLSVSKKFREFNRTCIQTNDEKETLGRFIGAGITGTRLAATNEVLKEDLLEYNQFPSLIIDVSDEFNYLYNKFITIIPSSVQSIYDLTIEAFNVSQSTKKIVILKVETIFTDIYSDIETFDNALPVEKISNEKIENPYSIYETYETNDSEILIIAYGFFSEIVKDNVKYFRNKNINIGLVKLITLNPFPMDQIKQLYYRNKIVILLNLPFINSISNNVYNINENNCRNITEKINDIINFLND